MSANEKGIVTYTADSGNEIKLSLNTVRNTLCENQNVTNQEFMMFAALCKAHKLDPFIREAYIIKYGDRPATVCVGKEAYTKRAFRNPKFRGMSAGLFLLDANGKGKEREGSMVLPSETVVGAWAKVYVEGYQEPIYDSVSFDEYAGRKKDGSLNQAWASKPGTMIRKVAIVHALREAFPEELGGMYDQVEMESAIQQEEPQQVIDVSKAIEEARPWDEPVYEEAF